MSRTAIEPTRFGPSVLDFANDDEMRQQLRREFSPEQIGQVDKGYGPIDFVGHAAVTDRLNECAPGWTYEPTRVVEVHGAMVDTGERKNGKPVMRFQLDPAGMPHVVAIYGWIEVGGVRRWEVGQVDNVTTYGDELKKGISDFIVRGAMRFGVALDLWSKQDLQASASSAHSGLVTPGAGEQAHALSPGDADGGAVGDSLPTPSGPAIPSPSSEVAPAAPGGGDISSEPEDAATGEGVDPRVSDERRDKLWMQLMEFAGGKTKAVNEVNKRCKTSFQSRDAHLIHEDEIELTLREVLKEAG